MKFWYNSIQIPRGACRGAGITKQEKRKLEIETNVDPSRHIARQVVPVAVAQRAPREEQAPDGQPTLGSVRNLRIWLHPKIANFHLESRMCEVRRAVIRATCLVFVFSK